MGTNPVPEQNRGAAEPGRAGSIYPTGNQRVRLAVSGPEFPDTLGVPVWAWFGGHPWSCPAITMLRRQMTNLHRFAVTGPASRLAGLPHFFREGRFSGTVVHR